VTTSDELLQSLRGLHPKLIDLSLGRIEMLLEKLDNPHHRLPPVIHVAGTNGKGSTCAYLKAMLEAAGRRVQVYTSPHLVRFHERIALPGRDGKARPIDDAFLVDVLSRTAAANGGAPITFFEITTAAAFLAFSETPADALILEVGLGGRLDTTNVVANPALTILTSISMDHTQLLGDTVEKIAFEKAGILKRGVTCIVAPQEDAVLDVIRAQARKIRAPLIIAGEHFTIFAQHGRLIVQGEEQLADLPLPALPGPHQLANAGTAVVAAQHLATQFGIGEDAIGRGLQDVRWPARMQRFTSGRLLALLEPGSELWLDGAHNPDAARVIASTVADLEERNARPLYLVTAMLRNKDAAGYFEHFRGLARKIVCVPIPGDDGAADPRDLVGSARALGFEADAAPDIATALTEARRHAGAPARVLICGSLHLAGHVLALEDGVSAQRN
jgi:dihydrofolate synthase / folylpolyglutamate synthase